MPDRIQLSRAKGWRMPPNTVKVDRTTRWGNTARIGDDLTMQLGEPCPSATAADCVRAYRKHVEWARGHDGGAFLDWISPLRGKSLACWCKPGAPCHADVLLELANA
jgi:hypothetical protein